METFCGACHAKPRPESFPRDAWYAEVQRGFDFYHKSKRTDLRPPPLQKVVDYYRALAPERLERIPVRSQRDVADASDVPYGDGQTHQFQAARISLPGASPFPAVANVHCQATAQGELLWCDMQLGEVHLLQFAGRELARRDRIAEVPHPSHIEPCDLDADGQPDWLVADLGSFEPADHDRGRVIWLRRVAGENGEQDRSTGPHKGRLRWRPDRFQSIVLADGLGRVADVRPADVDGDGLLDLAVAEFGWHDTGRVLLLKGLPPAPGDAASPPRFEQLVLDPRPGAIHVPIADINGDGRLDVVALISQEHEQVVVYLGQPDGTFQKELVYAAPDPAFGSSGIQLVDLDGDDDLDVLYTNGDMLDSFYIKPYHAVHWLENTGTFPFVPRQLATMAGAMRAEAADIDGDGDQDIVVCAFIPDVGLRGEAHPGNYETLMLLEQTTPGAFRRRTLEVSSAGHMSLATGDVDGDGKLDIIVGNFANQPRDEAHWGEIMWNVVGPKPN
ncbi:MAG: VCBS repeat-containing protein [Planctomycetales bacterium]|nr:VCBS repeat-containing protein [Planctomycetales bacterium]